MKLKLDESGNVVVQNGMPVYVHEDGKEIPFDAPAAMGKIGQLNTESATHRHKANEYKTLIEGLGDIDEAREAVETVKKMKGKKLFDSGEVDALREELGKTFKIKEDALNATVSEKDAAIRRLTVTSAFAGSEFVSKKTVLSPGIAESALGNYFNVVEKDGTVSVVAKLNGTEVFSRERPGEYAGFEEAISIIVDSRPDKDSILRGVQNGGSGGPGGAGGNGTGNNPWKTGNRTEQAALIKNDQGAAKRLATEAGVTIAGLNA
jgi:hypothetical protein